MAAEVWKSAKATLAKHWESAKKAVILEIPIEYSRRGKLYMQQELYTHSRSILKSM